MGRSSTTLSVGGCLCVAKERTQESLDGFWSTLSAEQTARIEAVAMDMWEAYENSVREHVPGAQDKIAFDKFHMAKHLNEAVDRVHKAEHKVLKAQGDERLTGIKYKWLRSQKNFSDEQWREF